MFPESETSFPPLVRTMPGQGHPRYILGAVYLSIYVSIHHVGCQRGITDLKTTCCDVTRQTAAPQGSLFPAEVCGAGAACSPLRTVPRGRGFLLLAGSQRKAAVSEVPGFVHAGQRLQGCVRKKVFQSAPKWGSVLTAPCETRRSCYPGLRPTGNCTVGRKSNSPITCLSARLVSHGGSSQWPSHVS